MRMKSCWHAWRQACTHCSRCGRSLAPLPPLLPACCAPARPHLAVVGPRLLGHPCHTQQTLGPFPRCTPLPPLQCALVVGALWLVGDQGVRKRVLKLLHQKGRTLASLRSVLLELRASIGDEGGLGQTFVLGMCGSSLQPRLRLAVQRTAACGCCCGR